MRTYFNILVSWRLRTVLLGVCACLCGAMLNTKAGRFQQTAHFLLWVSKAPEQPQLVLVQQRYNSEPHKGSDVYLVPGISYSNENRLLWRMTRWIIFKKYYFKKIEKPYPGRLRRISGVEKKKSYTSYMKHVKKISLISQERRGHWTIVWGDKLEPASTWRYQVVCDVLRWIKCRSLGWEPPTTPPSM